MTHVFNAWYRRRVTGLRRTVYEDKSLTGVEIECEWPKDNEKVAAELRAKAPSGGWILQGYAFIR